MPVHGAQPTDGAFQTAATPRKRNAWLRCGVLGEDADPIHSPGRPTGPPPGAGISPTRPGAIGAPIRPFRRLASPIWQDNSGEFLYMETRLCCMQTESLAAPCPRVGKSRCPAEMRKTRIARDRMVGPGVVPRHSDFNSLGCQTALTANTGAKGILRCCQISAIMIAMVRRFRIVRVNDRMQRGYRYALTAPTGRNFDPEFRPELTP